MKEPIYIPEEHLEEFVMILYKGMKNSRINKDLRKIVTEWCEEIEEYLKD
jgi:hypothetical protein